MLCPKCGVQCKQYEGLGEGNNDEGYYDTAMVLECKECGKLFIEFYAVFEPGENLGRLLTTANNLLKKINAR